MGRFAQPSAASSAAPSQTVWNDPYTPTTYQTPSPQQNYVQTSAPAPNANYSGASGQQTTPPPSSSNFLSTFGFNAIPDPNATYQQSGKPGQNNGVFSNPSWNPGGFLTPEQQAQNDYYNQVVQGNKDFESHINPILPFVPPTGRSAPDAPPDPIWSPQQMWWFQNCTLITGEAKNPPPPGC